MKEVDKKVLREAAVNCKHAGETPFMPFDQRMAAFDEFKRLFTPNVQLALLDELETKEEQRANWFQMAQKLGEDLDAAEKRIEEETCRANREHHRGFMMACNHLKDHANVHYADAAEMEIAALRQRIAELEARTVTLPVDRAAESEVSGYDGTEFYRAGWNARGKADRDALAAAGIGVKGE